MEQFRSNMHMQSAPIHHLARLALLLSARQVLSAHPVAPARLEHDV
jgi:hypothetical protein